MDVQLSRGSKDMEAALKQVEGKAFPHTFVKSYAAAVFELTENRWALHAGFNESQMKSKVQVGFAMPYITQPGDAAAQKCENGIEGNKRRREDDYGRGVKHLLRYLQCVPPGKQFAVSKCMEMTKMGRSVISE